MRPLPARAERLLLIAPLQQGSRAVLVLILANVILITLWHIVAASERGAMNATVGNLAHSLNALAAENMAQGRPLDAGWATRNPFVLLRGQQGNYCGELADGQTPSRGCWYFLPQQARVLYRARFSGWRSGGEEGVQVWQLVRLPQQTMETAETGRLTAVELRAVDRIDR
ncbi:hypothetical protein KRX52_11595 [Pseudomonas sp. MAP12]|uniref:Uncharacterized protein n=1 Tax=Geopseudomonas aromaticivorans TaxID=2849492 RepID=A0ABS6MXA3_9GAMM|nr:hypothetical protein [Pseudomonas aromaticivorans]MBV2133432.1 hypothetical protein [Pseudomonas aromaticivorans]